MTLVCNNIVYVSAITDRGRKPMMLSGLLDHLRGLFRDEGDMPVWIELPNGDRARIDAFEIDDLYGDNETTGPPYLVISTQNLPHHEGYAMYYLTITPDGAYILWLPNEEAIRKYVMETGAKAYIVPRLAPAFERMDPL